MTLLKKFLHAPINYCALAALVFAATPALAAEADVAAALAHPDRPSEEAANDARRKPAEILEKMIAGKLRKTLSEMSLTGQAYVMDTTQTVEAVLAVVADR